MSFLNRNNLFGDRGGRPPSDQYGPPPGASPGRGPRPQYRNDGYDTPMNNGGYDAPPRGYGGTPPPRRPMPGGPPMGRNSSGGGPPGRSQGGGSIRLQPTKAPDNSYTFRNLVAVSSREFPPSHDGDIFLMLNGLFVVSARPMDAFPPGSIGLSEPQRTWMGIALTDHVEAEMFDPFGQGGYQAYIGAMDIEVGFASTRKTTDTPYDQDDLAREITNVRSAYERAG
jgi:vesicle-fusing ATPase